MKPTPPGWPRSSSALCYERAAEALAWLTRAFGFEVRLMVPGENGSVVHAELVFGEAVFMVGDLKPDKYPNRRAPTQAGGLNTQSIMVYVDDVDAHSARARAAGASIVTEPTTTDYGEQYWSDRGYECVDLGGHHWFFAERIRTSPAQLRG
jgi:uncharacterized glyoxalase superfamily protein PhnB